MTPTSALDLQQLPMTIESELLGTLDVSAEDVYHFASGIFGFQGCHDFVLVGAERPGLYWLQSTEFSALTFLMVDPFLYFDGYALDLGAPDMRELDVESSSDVSILAIVTLPPDRKDLPTANLQGPVAFNVRSHLAKQVVIEHSPHGTRCAFELDQPTGAA